MRVQVRLQRDHGIQKTRLIGKSDRLSGIER